jgi:predicted NACHT family NTPase
MTISLLIKALEALADSQIVKDKILRSEWVIKLLKQFGLDPDHPPSDFEGVYQYALVEYGVGKPRLCLEIFRQQAIRLVFQKALNQNNPSLWLREGEDFLDRSPLGTEIRNLGLDPKRELTAFATVFIEIAKRTRTPAEVLTNQKIESMHRAISVVINRIDRLPTLEGLRTELARLAQDDLALPATSEKSKTFALAQQLRGWFETLDYTFEFNEVWEDHYFEWTINYRVGRRQYNRVLVRGIEGPAELSDLMALSKSVEENRTDEGWLVTTRRISPAARAEILNEGNDHLSCYTFDELLDQDADFTSYLDWLEVEIQNRQIQERYVPLACSKEELDLVTKQRVAVSRYGVNEGWIDGYIDQWLDDPAKEHISVLGEFGTGKTWFAMHYAWIALQRYRAAQKRGTERPRLPLVIPLRDYAKAVSVESLFSEFFFRKHAIPIPGYAAFEHLNRMGKLLLIFDGFDEMAARVNRQEMINNFWELAKIVVPGSKVILTCRTEHFPEVKEGRALLNAELKASTINFNERTPQFEVLELEKFNDEQIQQVLSLQSAPDVVELVMKNSHLLDLARRPVMTELILEALPDIEAGKPVDMSRVYLYAVRRKMERDIKADRTFTSMADKLYFLCELSWEMLSNDKMSLNYREFPDRIRKLFGVAVQEEKDLDHWHYDMMGQTMLIRNADGDYTPAHRSLLEFFVSYKFAAELGGMETDFLELARMRLDADSGGNSKEYKWSEYFKIRDSTSIAPLKNFTQESLEVLRSNFGRAPLTKILRNMLGEMLVSPTSLSEHPLLRAIKKTQYKMKIDVNYVGGNAATLLCELDEFALENRDLRSAVINGADLSSASLRNTNCTQVDFTGSSFSKANGRTMSIAFSPDGKTFATGASNGECCLWQSSDGRLIMLYVGHTDWVRTVKIFPCGKVLASGSGDSTVKLWNLQTGNCIKTLRGHTETVYKIAVNFDGSRLASGSEDGTIRIWCSHTGECVNILKGHIGRVSDVIFTVDSKILISSSMDQTIRFWNLRTGQCDKILEYFVETIVVSPDGITFVSGNRDGTIKIWNVHTGECLKTLQGHGDLVRVVVISQDASTLISGSKDELIKFWDLKTATCFKSFKGHTYGIQSIALNPACTTLITCGDDQTIKLWDTKIDECLKVLHGFNGEVSSVAFTSDSKTLITGSHDQTVKLWDVKTGKHLQSFRGHTSWVYAVAISSDNKTIISAGDDRTLMLWDIKTGKCLRTWNKATSNLSFAISQDNNLLAIGDGQTIEIWNFPKNEFLYSLHGHTRSITNLCFTPDGNYLASSSIDKTIRLWVLGTRTFKILKGHTGVIWSIDANPSSTSLASGSRDGTVKLWDIHTGNCIQTLQGHTTQVESVKFSPDGNVLASGSLDQTIRLWDTHNGRCIDTLKGHQGRIWSIAFSPNGHILASGSQDNTVKLWSVETGNYFNTLVNKPYEGMNITELKGLTEIEKSTLKVLGAIEPC